MKRTQESYYWESHYRVMAKTYAKAANIPGTRKEVAESLLKCADEAEMSANEIASGKDWKEAMAIGYEPQDSKSIA